MKKISGLLLVFLWLAFAVTSLQALVNQRICVAKFNLKGAGENSFMPLYFQKVLERELDKTGRIYVIREYLWQNVYNSELDPSNPASVQDFGLETKIEGVVSGTIDISDGKKITVSCVVRDILNNKQVFTRQFTTDGSEKLFSDSEMNISETVKFITNYFKPMDPKAIVEQRKVIKKVYVTGRIHDLDISLRAGIFNNQLQYSLNGGTMLNNGDHIWTSGSDRNLSCLCLQVSSDIRYKRFSFDPDFFFSLNKDYSLNVFYFDFMFWVIPDTVAIGPGMNICDSKYLLTVDMVNNTNRIASYPAESTTSQLFISLKFKPKNLSFGIGFGIPVFFIANQTILQNTFPIERNGMNMFIYYDFYFGHNIGGRIDMNFLDLNVNTGSGGELNQHPNRFGIQVYYKFEWSGKK